MNNATKFLTLTAALYCAVSSLGEAQQPPSTKPPSSTAQSEAGEPRADTSNPAAEAPEPAAKPTGAAARNRRAAPGAAAAESPAGRPPTGTPAAATTAGATPAGSGSAKSTKADRLDLGTATVTGDREQPKVMYIVPWKRSDIGDLAGKPMNSLVDEILAPVDRDVFKREVVYYRAVQADASQNGAPPKPAQQGEK